MASTSQVLTVDAAPDLHAAAETRLAELESRWSRFIASSDISRFNAAAGEWIDVSTDTIRLVEAMQLAHSATSGRYDPTYLHRLLTAGYVSSIDDPERITVAVDVRSPDVSVHDVEIDRVRSRLRGPFGLSLDPGGIGKGFAADLVVTELLAAGVAGALVSVGGDLAAAGHSPCDRGWLVHVEDPFDRNGRIATFALSAGGVATSSTLTRRWTHDGVERHHTIDPITGDIAETDLASVTVVANSGWLAEAHASATLLCGFDGALDHLTGHGLDGLAVGIDGNACSTSDLRIEGLVQ